MKALSIRQPYANLIASGRKTLEIRSWKTAYRGPFTVCSSARPEKGWVFGENDLGKQICAVELVDVIPWTRELSESAYVNPAEWWAGHWAWVLRDPRPVERIRVKGRLNWFELPEPALLGYTPSI